MGGNVIVGIKSIAKLLYMMNEDGNKKAKNYYGKQNLLDYDRFVKKNKEEYNLDFDELADEFIAEYINE
jgi:hypothetical protein